MKSRNSFIIILLCLFSCSSYAQGIHSETHNNSGLKFIPNQGQIVDRNFNPRLDVLFQIEGKGIFLRENGLTFVLTNIEEAKHEAHEKTEEIEDSPAGLGHHSEPEWEAAFLSKAILDVQQVSMTFLNSEKNHTVSASGQSKDYLNYYLAQCPNGVTHIKTYAQIEYKQLYQGIDLYYYTGGNGELKYDFRIRPNADPSQIKLKWSGANNVSVQNDGSLLVETQLRNLTESMPLVYQLIDGDTIEVQAQYSVKSKRNKSFIVSYDVGAYNPAYELIIDPWITNYGGISNENSWDVATDNEGHVFITGSTISATAIAEDGFVNELVGEPDAFLVKFNEAGERIWGTYYGGVLTDYAASLAIDADNDIYMAGSSFSEDGIAFEGHQNTHGGVVDAWIFTYGDAFLVKFDSDGERIWGTYYGGENGDVGEDVSVSNDGFVYLSGKTNSDTGIASEDGFQVTYGGGDGGPEGVPGDAFLVKFTADGDRVWGTYYGDLELDYGNAAFPDDEGNVYMCGTTASTIAITTPGSYQEVFAGMQDAYIVKFAADGDRIWGTYFGGELQERGSDLVIDTIENAIYISGSTTSPYDIAFEGFQMTRGDIDDFVVDAFLAKFSLDGERIWSTYFGGEGHDYSIDLGLDKETGNIAICGDTYSLDLPMSDCAIQTELGGLENAFATQFDPSGALYCSSYFGAEHEENNRLAFGGCYLYVTGTSPVGVATVGAHQEEFGGASDAYLAQLFKSSCGVELPVIEFTAEKIDVTDCNSCDGAFEIAVSTAGCIGNIGGINYRWSTGEEFLNTTDSTSAVDGLCPGEHWVEIQLDCGVRDTFFFEIGSDLNIPNTAFDHSASCVGQPITFTDISTTPEGTIVSRYWLIDGVEVSTDETFDSVFYSAGIYEVLLFVVNSDGCEDSLIYELTVHPIYEELVEITVCQDSLVTFGDGHQIYVTNDTTYAAMLTSAFGCDSLITTSVFILANTHSADTIFVPFGTTIELFNGDEMIIEQTYVDTASIINNNGCDSTIIITYLIDQFTFSPPNIFSPNADGANNNFYFPNKDVKTFQCVIVNRWGVEVFHFNAITDQWDGKNEANGKNCSDGVYFYTYTGTFINDEFFQGQGTVQLVGGK